MKKTQKCVFPSQQTLVVIAVVLLLAVVVRVTVAAVISFVLIAVVTVVVHILPLCTAGSEEKFFICFTLLKPHNDSVNEPVTLFLLQS